MEQPSKSRNTSANLVKRDEKGRILPGQQSLNPDGKPVGALDFKTKWFKFIDKVAKQNDITPDEVDEQLLAVAFKQAKDANYPFYRDIQDRVHGKPVQPFGGDDGKPIIIKVVKEIAEQNGLPTDESPGADRA